MLLSILDLGGFTIFEGVRLNFKCFGAFNSELGPKFMGH
jgi:hypothetical protein